MIDTDCIHEIHRDWCGQCNPRLAASLLDEWIDAVSMIIPGDAEPPMPMAELCEATGLTRAQVGKAVAAIRERHQDLPLVSDRRGIRFTMDADAVRDFRNRGVRTALTRIRRSYRGALLPWMEQSGIPDTTVRQIRRQFDRLLEDVAEAVEV